MRENGVGSSVLYTLNVGGVPAVDIRRVGCEEEVLRLSLVDLGWKRPAHMRVHVGEGQGSGIAILQMAEGNRDCWWSNQSSLALHCNPSISAQPTCRQESLHLLPPFRQS